jgi:hypothetical protein
MFGSGFNFGRPIVGNQSHHAQHGVCVRTRKPFFSPPLLYSCPHWYPQWLAMYLPGLGGSHSGSQIRITVILAPGPKIQIISLLIYNRRLQKIWEPISIYNLTPNTILKNLSITFLSKCLACASYFMKTVGSLRCLKRFGSIGSLILKCFK